MLKDVNIRTSLMLPYLYSTTAAYTSLSSKSCSSFLAENQLQLSFLCLYFLLEHLPPSSLRISAFPHHLLPPFYSICLSGFPPLSFSRSFYFFYLLGLGLCSVSSSRHSLTPAKGTFPCMKSTREAPPHWLQERMPLLASFCNGLSKRKQRGQV